MVDTMRALVGLVLCFTGASFGCQEGDDSTTVVAEPIQHRSESVSCDRERATNPYSVYAEMSAPECTVDSDCSDFGTCEGSACQVGCIADPDGRGLRCAAVTGECLRDSDCADGENGRCQDSRIGYRCTYDTCFADSECTTGGPCDCGDTGQVTANTCLPGNCQTDADCESGFCSPSLDACGNFSQVAGYFCHVPSDTCSNDDECVSETAGPGHCLYQSEFGHWQCSYVSCIVG